MREDPRNDCSQCGQSLPCFAIGFTMARKRDALLTALNPVLKGEWPHSTGAEATLFEQRNALIKACERILDAIKWKNMAEDDQVELLRAALAKSYANPQRKPAPWRMVNNPECGIMLVYDKAASNPTPGPWTHQTHRRIGSHSHLDGKPAMYDVELVVSEVGEHPTPICQMDQSTEAFANARLLAASWDLLKAAQTALNCLNGRYDCAHARTELSAAIAKALPE